MSFIVKNTTFSKLLDLLAPHSCRGCGALGEAFCDRCKKDIAKRPFRICPNCKCKKFTPKCQKCKTLPPIFVIADYDGVMGSLIHELKYNSVRRLGHDLADLLDQALPNLPKDAIIVPLPTATNHIRKRGLDHTLLIAKHLAKSRHIKTQKILTRKNNTVQVGSDRKTRLSQAKSAFEINPKTNLSPRSTYLLIDDVWTTGASMRAAIKKLQQAGAKNIIVALLAARRLDH